MRKLVLITLLGIFLYSCTPKVELPEITSGRANFTNYVVIGDGYMAGYQDGALFHDGQMRSIGALIFQSLQQAGTVSYNQALMSDNVGLGISSKPWDATYITSSTLNYKIDCEGISSLGPIKILHTITTAQPYLDPVSALSLDDYSVPFATTSDLSSGTLFMSNVYWARVAANFSNVSPKQAAVNRGASFFSAWLGMEDIYNYARNGGYGKTIPSVSTFANNLDNILGPLTTNGAKGVLATIPDFRSFPYYTLIKWNAANLNAEDADTMTQIYASGGLGHISFVEGNNGFVIDDPDAPSGYRQLLDGEYITVSVPTDSMKCEYYGILFNTIHNRYVLDSAEVELLDNMIYQYNETIKAKALQYDLAVVDLNAYFKTVNDGVTWNGVKFTAEFVKGGFFGLDGQYPTQKGAALIANQFILAINNFYGSTLPTITCQECNGIIFP